MVLGLIVLFQRVWVPIPGQTIDFISIVLRMDIIIPQLGLITSWIRFGDFIDLG